MKLLNTETPVTRNFIPQILLNVQDFYFHTQVMTKASSDLRQSIEFNSKFGFSLTIRINPHGTGYYIHYVLVTKCNSLEDDTETHCRDMSSNPLLRCLGGRL
jgi:hypothetical protein